MTGKALGEMGGVFTPLEQIRLFSEIDESSEIIILSFNRMMGSAIVNFNGNRIYPHAVERIEFMRNLFPYREISLFFSAVNPGTVIADLQYRFPGLPGGRPPDHRPLWSEMIDRVQEAHIDLPVSIWATEDTPVIWPAILCEVLDASTRTPPPGSLHLAAKILSDKLRTKMMMELREMPPLDSLALMEYLEKYLSESVDEGMLQDDIGLSGWSQDVIQDFELIYEQDIQSCEDVPGNKSFTIETVFETA
ncbi:unnamed protein product [Laminaria digitata]